MIGIRLVESISSGTGRWGWAAQGLDTRKCVGLVQGTLLPPSACFRAVVVIENRAPIRTVAKEGPGIFKYVSRE